MFRIEAEKLLVGFVLAFIVAVDIRYNYVR